MSAVLEAGILILVVIVVLILRTGSTLANTVIKNGEI